MDRLCVAYHIKYNRNKIQQSENIAHEYVMCGLPYKIQQI